MPKEKEKKIIKTPYNVSGGKLERKNKSCPKCGAGIFMAQHSDRWTCGKCGYSEIKSKKSE